MGRFVLAALVLAAGAQAGLAVPARNLASYRELMANSGGVVVGRVVAVEPREDRTTPGDPVVRVDYRVLVATVERGPAKPGEELTLRAWFPIESGGFSFGCGAAPRGTMSLPGVGETTRVFYSLPGDIRDNGFWPPGPPAREDETCPPAPAVGADRGELIRRTQPLGLPIDLRNWYWWALGAILLFALVSAGRPGRRVGRGTSPPSTPPRA